MDEEIDPAPCAGPAPLDQVKQSVHSDLQYVSVQVEGATYGGWYRVLADGQMELLALANMHCERRHESNPLDQARGMLTDFIRVARPKSKTNGSAAANGNTGSDVRSAEDRPQSDRGTLGDLLYVDTAKVRVPEKDWTGLVQSIAVGDQLALWGLYERTHRIVFTLVLRLTNNVETAEQLTLDVFHDVWRRAGTYDAAAGSVVGWIMNQARSRAIDHLTFERGSDSAHAHANSSFSMGAAIGSDAIIDLSELGCTTDVLRPSATIWGRLAQRIAAESNREPVSPAAPQWAEPEWEEVAQGISCKLLATDTDKDLVSMLVRLAPGVDYPPHSHAGVEELHLLHGELLINDRKLYPGDYSRAEPGTADTRVWSETGCACVLITSTRDVLG